MFFDESTRRVAKLLFQYFLAKSARRSPHGFIARDEFLANVDAIKTAILLEMRSDYLADKSSLNDEVTAEFAGLYGATAWIRDEAEISESEKFLQILSGPPENINTQVALKYMELLKSVKEEEVRLLIEFQKRFPDFLMQPDQRS